jgi:hypothetical protein
MVLLVVERGDKIDSPSLGARGVRAIVRQTPDTINTGPGARRPGWADGFATMTAHDVKQPIVFPRRDCARAVN